MPASTTAARRPRKAIILAAGKDDPGARPLLLERLGDQSILELVADNVRQLMAPEDIYVVVGRQHEAAIRAQLGDRYTYVLQDEPAGTGHAVLQVEPMLDGFDGDLLILYGDTPLFRPASIRGLLNRHDLKGAELTLLTAVVDRPLPYGRIQRDGQGQIQNIVEAADAGPDEQAIQELNLGAYVGRARPDVDPRGHGRIGRAPPDRRRGLPDRLGQARRELPDLRPGRSPGHQLRGGPAAGRVHPPEAALPAPPQ